MQPFIGLHPSTTRPILTPKLEQRSFCSAQNPASFGVKLAYGVVFAGNPSKEKTWNFSVHQEVSGFSNCKLEIYCSIGFIVGILSGTGLQCFVMLHNRVFTCVPGIHNPSWFAVILVVLLSLEEFCCQTKRSVRALLCYQKISSVVAKRSNDSCFFSSVASA